MDKHIIQDKNKKERKIQMKKKNQIKKGRSKGITLIALVITIIVLLILALQL